MINLETEQLEPLEKLETNLLPLKTKLFKHSLYSKLQSIEQLKLFMTFHVFAVWDFMNLLCNLQTHFTSTSSPWIPPTNPDLARLVNEIKLEEESDIIDGEVISHFQYYVKSMSALGVDTSAIIQFQNALRTESYKAIINHKCVPKAAQCFLQSTYDSIQLGLIPTAAYFTFGRETIIPEMFVEVLKHTSNKTKETKAFCNYLERHIELDGDSHATLAKKILTILCQSNESYWQVAETAAKKSINARLALFDEIEKTLLFSNL